MEFATGESLDVALRHLAPAPLERVLPMLDAIASAIDTAWAGGIGHGALHPRDVIVAPGTLDVRVTGFGFVPALESIGLTPPARRPYSAPERAAGEGWDIRADIYSLGAIAYELVTGRRPVGSGEPDEATPLHLVLATALAVNPVDRFASARAFVDALEEVARDEAVETEPAVAAATPVEPAAAVSLLADVQDAELDLVAASQPLQEIDFTLAPTPAAEAPEHGGGPVPVPAIPIAAPLAISSDTLDVSEDDMPRHTPSPSWWVALAVVGLAGVVVGSVGTYLAIGRGEAPPVVPLTTPESAQARAETEVQVTPPPSQAGVTPPPASADLPPAAPPVPEKPAVSRPPRTDAPVRAAATPGRLVVRSEPSGALVTLDGRRVGETPLTLRDLALGTHSVQVARPGYAPETRRVTLSTSTPTLTVSVALRSGAAKPTAKPAVKTGSVYLDSKPRGARVLIDGKPYGTTPILVPELAPGKHAVRFELEGHAPSTSSVTVKAGEQARVSASLVRR